MVGSFIFNNYLPVFTACLGAFLGYILSNRKYKLERFYKDGYESIKEFYSPAYQQLRKIIMENEPKKREDLLDLFMEKYRLEDGNIYMSCNQNIIQKFYDLDEVYFQFKKDRSKEKWADIWRKLKSIYYDVDKEYWNMQESLYNDFHWQKFLTKRNYLFKLFMEIMVFFYKTMSFIVAIWVLMLYILLCDRISGQKGLPDVIISNFPKISYLVIIIFLFCVIFALPYLMVNSDYKRRNKISIKIDAFLGKKIITLKKKKTNTDNIPPMYDRNW